MLGSCIDGREEYWLAADGSGRAEIHYDVPAAIANGLGGTAGVTGILDKFIKDTPTLTNATRRVTRKQDRMTVDFKASFKSVFDLVAAVRDNSVLTAGDAKSLLDPLLGQFDIRQRMRRIDFTRTVSPGKALPGLMFMPASQLEGRHLLYIMHLPVAARESNATRTADGGRTLIWEHALNDRLHDDVVMHLNAEVPVPWFLPAAIVAALVLAGWLAIRAWRRRRISKHGLTVSG